MILVTLLFTTLIGFPVDSTFPNKNNNCTDITCKPTQSILCVKITSPQGEVLYTPMYECAVTQLSCTLEKDANITFVRMSKCRIRTLAPSRNRLQRVNPILFKKKL